MAHNLNILDGVASMAYTGETPWHGLGQRADSAMTSQQAMELGRLNFKLEKCPIQAILPQDLIKIPVPNQYAIVRTDTRKALGIVGERYTIVPNAECFSFFDSIVGEGKAIFHTVGALGEGEVVWIMAKLPNDIVVKDRDIINSYLLLKTSHDGSCSVQAKFTPVRVVCQNTLSMAFNGKTEVSIRHTETASDKLKLAHKLMGIVSQQFEETRVSFDKLASKEINSAEVTRLTTKLLKLEDKKADDVSTRAENISLAINGLFATGKGNMGRTLWDWYNGVTEYVDHKSTVREGSNRWEANTFNPNRLAMKERALDLALAAL